MGGGNQRLLWQKSRDLLPTFSSGKPLVKASLRGIAANSVGRKEKRVGTLEWWILSIAMWIISREM